MSQDEILTASVIPGAAQRFRALRPSADAAKKAAAQMGFDVADLEGARATRLAEVHAAAERRLREEIADSEASAARLGALAAAQTAGLVHRSGAVDAPSSGFFNIDTPSRIFTIGDLSIDSSDRVSFNSFAKVQRPKTAGQDHQELVFVFPWVNTSGVDQVMTITTVVGLTGVVSADDAGGWTVFGHDHNTLVVQVLLRMFAETDDTEALGLQLDQWTVANIDAFEDSWPMSVGAIVSQNVTRGIALSATDLLVKAGQTRIFHAVVTFDANAPGGDAGFDFSSGAFKISEFGLFVHVTS
jgi:hypothetical protein